MTHLHIYIYLHTAKRLNSRQVVGPCSLLGLTSPSPIALGPTMLNPMLYPVNFERRLLL